MNSQIREASGILPGSLCSVIAVERKLRAEMKEYE
jgi:hypothetical protein